MYEYLQSTLERVTEFHTDLGEIIGKIKDSEINFSILVILIDN